MNQYVLSINETAIKELEAMLLNDSNELNILPAAAFEDFNQHDISGFCVRHGIYQMPTLELIEWLREMIPDLSKTIEIGAGNGCIGRALRIPMYDNYMQGNEEVKAMYEIMMQPPVIYGADVIKMNANKAVNTFKPETVVGCWVTQKYQEGDTERNIGSNMYGINEVDFIGKIKQYIVVGNERTHHDKRILNKVRFRTYKFDWLISRSLYKEKNLIYVMDCTK